MEHKAYKTARVFMLHVPCFVYLFITIYYPAPRLVIWRHFDRHAISHKNADMVHAHFPCQMRKDFPLILIKLYAKKGVWQRLRNEAFLPYGFLVGHKR